MSNKDTIYRQAAIDALANYIHNLDKLIGAGRLSAYDCEYAATSVFADLPSVQPEQRWIPCSERLPNGQENVNVSVHDTSGDTPFDYSAPGWITTDHEYWIVDNEINNYVTAWQPLPEPWKGKAE